MRISTSAFYQSGTSRLSDLQAGLDKMGRQVAAGRRLLTPAEDPAAAVQALKLQESEAVNGQFAKNRDTMRSSLSSMDTTMSGMLNVLSGMEEQVIAMGNGTLSNKDLTFLTEALNQNRGQLLSLANSTDGAGHYLFSGQDSASAPFQTAANGTVSYAGSTTEQNLQVDSNRQMALSRNGANLLPVNASGNNLFAVVDQAIAKLKDPTLTQQDRTTQLSNLNQALSTARDAISTQQTKVGTDLVEIDHLDQIGVSRSLDNADTLSKLQDLDYTKALSDLSRQQLILQASQKTFSQISSLSLFDYIR